MLLVFNLFFFLTADFVKMHLTGTTKQPLEWTLKWSVLKYWEFPLLSRCKRRRHGEALHSVVSAGLEWLCASGAGMLKKS